MQRGGPQEFGKGLRLPGEGIRDVTEVSHQLLNEVWKCLQTGYLDDLKTSESRLKTSAIVWKRLIQTFQIFGKILMPFITQHHQLPLHLNHNLSRLLANALQMKLCQMKMM